VTRLRRRTLRRALIQAGVPVHKIKADALPYPRREF